MNVLYALSNQDDWVEFAIEMKTRLNWLPTYWLTGDLSFNTIRERFPECVVHRYREVIEGKSPAEFDAFKANTLDENTVKEYAFELDQAMKMMDRLDSGDAFSYNERKRYFFKILNYSINVIRYCAPKLAVFTETPHHASQYILYVALKKHGIKTIMFKPAFLFENRLLIYSDINDDPVCTLEGVHLSRLTESARKHIDHYVSLLRGDYTEATPSYMKTLNRNRNVAGVFIKAFYRFIRKDKLSNLFSKRVTTNVVKLKNSTIENSRPDRFDLYRLKIKGLKQKRRLKKLYNQLCKSPDLEKEFVFIPLHYQPERTSSPDAGAYVDQFLMISLIRASLPESVPILVKEHVAQFYSKMEGHLSRFEFNYLDIAALPNVHMVRSDFPSFELIDKSLCVATLAGTVGLEAVARKKPVLVFGAGCWYRSLPGVFFTPNKESLAQALTIIQGGFTPDPTELNAFLYKTYQASFLGKLAPHYEVSLTPLENAKNLADAVENYSKNVFSA